MPSKHLSPKNEDEFEMFVRMAREFPARTAIFTFGLPVFALLQFVNGAVNGGSLTFIGLFVVLVLVHTVLITRYQLATYRRRIFTRRWRKND